MTTIYPAAQTAEANYKLMSGVVVPRPIAWISTVSPAGVVNLAPFSCYTFLSPKPPMVGINIGRRDGALKDTSRNIHSSDAFVVNIAGSAMLDAIHASADEYGPEVSEAELLGLALAPCDTIAVPRLADVPVALECRLHSVQEFGDLRAEFIVGEVTAFHFQDGVCVDARSTPARSIPCAASPASTMRGLARSSPSRPCGGRRTRETECGGRRTSARRAVRRWFGPAQKAFPAFDLGGHETRTVRLAQRRDAVIAELREARLQLR